MWVPAMSEAPKVNNCEVKVSAHVDADGSIWRGQGQHRGEPWERGRGRRLGGKRHHLGRLLVKDQTTSTQGLPRRLHSAAPPYWEGTSYCLVRLTTPSSTRPRTLQHSFSPIPETNQPLWLNLPALPQLFLLSRPGRLVFPTPHSSSANALAWLVALFCPPPPRGPCGSTTQHMQSHRACLCLHPIRRIRCSV